MKRIDKGDGVFFLEPETEKEEVYWGYGEFEKIVEAHISSEFSALAGHAFSLCRRLKRVYLPASVTFLGDAVFYGIGDTLEVFYDGPSEEFIRMATPYKKKVMVQVPSGPYDHQPYCMSEGNCYEEREEWQHFDSFAADCQVICADGVRLYYGFQNLDQKPSREN